MARAEFSHGGWQNRAQQWERDLSHSSELTALEDRVRRSKVTMLLGSTKIGKTSLAAALTERLDSPTHVSFFTAADRFAPGAVQSTSGLYPDAVVYQPVNSNTLNAIDEELKGGADVLFIIDEVTKGSPDPLDHIRVLNPYIANPHVKFLLIGQGTPQIQRVNEWLDLFPGQIGNGRETLQIPLNP